MFSTFFGSSNADPLAQNFHPVTSAVQPADAFGSLEPSDLNWTATASGFVTETQTFYSILEDGRFLMCQVIHSATGLWYPTIQFTCKIYDPKSKETTWKSLSVTNFVTPPPGQDKRSCKADQFTIVHRTGATTATPQDTAESYTLNVSLTETLQISLTVARPSTVAGFKYGSGPKGGMSYFGTSPTGENADGYVIHKFWPYTNVSGFITNNGHAEEIKGRGMLVHAIQGMRPNLVATRWNFVWFSSPQNGGVSAIQMEFTTTSAYGKKGNGSGGVSVNIGSLVVGGKLVGVSGETKWPGEASSASSELTSKATHHDTVHDPATGYDQPTKLTFEWGASLVPTIGSGTVKGQLELNVGSGDKTDALIEKVDVLAEIPYVVKAVVNMTGTKPYIYQWLTPSTLHLTGAQQVVGETGSLDVQGDSYAEASYIS